MLDQNDFIIALSSPSPTFLARSIVKDQGANWIADEETLSYWSESSEVVRLTVLIHQYIDFCITAKVA